MPKIREKIINAVRYIRELDRIALLGAATAVIPIVNSTLLLPFAPSIGYALKENPQIGLFVYLAAVWIVCGFALLPTNVAGILCGWAFGFPLGICLHMAAIVGASLISSFALAPLTGNNFQDFLQHHEKAKVIYKTLLRNDSRRAAFIIMLLRLSPAMPFALTNLLMTAARVPLRAFLVGTFLGMLPRSSAVVFFGAGLSELNLKEPFNIWLFLLGIAVTIFSVIIITRLGKQALAKITAENA